MMTTTTTKTMTIMMMMMKFQNGNNGSLGLPGSCRQCLCALQFVLIRVVVGGSRWSGFLRKRTYGDWWETGYRRITVHVPRGSNISSEPLGGIAIAGTNVAGPRVYVGPK